MAAVALGRLAGRASRSLGVGGGTALPGLLAQKVAPNLVRHLAARLPGGSVVVTGTNGKTTVASIISHVLAREGVKTVHNRAGSNLMRGIASALLDDANVWEDRGGSGATTGIFEVDEATLPQAVSELSPKEVVIGNLFRDQLDRYGEVDTVASLWRQALETLPSNSVVVLNSDDPLVASLGRHLDRRVLYFGLEDKVWGRKDLDHTADSKECPQCGTDLAYDRCFYSHMGHYECVTCGWHRPEPGLKATQVHLRGLSGVSFTLETKDHQEAVDMGLPGLYNAYNALAGAAATIGLGVSLEAVAKSLRDFTPAFGRAETVEVMGRTIRLLLAKNPVGLNAVLHTILADEGERSILFVLNDDIADGRDISWIWDVDFEELAGQVAFLGASGSRAEDMALRLKYAGIQPAKTHLGTAAILVERDLRRAIGYALTAVSPGGSLFIIPTYTAMLQVRKELAKLVGLRPFWERAQVNGKS